MQFIGFLVIMLLTGVTTNLVREVSYDPEFAAIISTYSPWAGAHAVELGWASAAVVFLVGITVPWFLLKKDQVDGGDRMGVIGSAVGIASVAYVLIFTAIPFVGYLLGMGFFMAQKTMGQ